MYEVPDSERSNRELNLEYENVIGRKHRIEDHIAAYKGWLWFFVATVIIGAVGIGAGIWMLLDELQRHYRSGGWFLDHGLSATVGCGGLLFFALGVWMSLDVYKGVKEERSRIPSIQRRLDEIDTELRGRLGA